MPVDPIARALFVSLGEITPLNVTANGTYEESGKVYSPVNVNVANSYSAEDEGKVVHNGALVSQSSQNIDSNGVYDTTLINSIDVNVSGGGGTSKLALVVGDYGGGTTSNYTITAEDLAGVTMFKNYAFFQCEKMTKITFPATIVNLGNFIFQNCRGLTEININEGVASIGTQCFDGCKLLPKIELPSTIESILGNAFKNCTSLQTFICKATTPPTLNASALTNVPADCAIYVPDASVDTYKAASEWSARASYIFPLSQYNP